MSKKSSVILAFVFAILIAAYPSANAVPAKLRLVQSGSIVLDKKSGSVDQVVEMDSGLVSRDSTLTPLSSQSVEKFNGQGKSTGKIGRFGETPGTFYALRSIGVSRKDGLIWVLDLKGRLSKFDAQGLLKSTMVFQTPGYNPESIAIDEGRNLFYVTGCVPLKVYLDLGCFLVHQYDEAKDKFQRSFLETEPAAVKRHYLSIEDYQVDVADDGSVFAIDSPMRKFWKIDPRNGGITAWPIASKLFEDIPDLDPTRPQGLSATYHLAERVLVTSSYVAISVRKPQSSGYVLEIFDHSGRQVAVDLASPGRLVGKSSAGDLWFVDTKSGNGQPFRLAKFKIAP